MINLKAFSKIGSVCLVAFLSSIAFSQDQADNYNPFFVVDNDEDNSNSPSHIPDERNCGSGTIAWGGNDYENVPGIYWAYIQNYCKEGIEITVWTDFTTTLFGSNADAREQGREITGNSGSQHSGLKGDSTVSGFIEANATLEYSFSMDSTGQGNGIINDIEYDLQNGTLFLVATKGEILDVRQVNYNLASISTEDIKLLATRHPEITSFFEGFHAIPD